MILIESHTVKELKAPIRLQEYGPLVFNTRPTRSSFKKAIKNQLVKVNGKIANTSIWVEQGQTIEVFQKNIKHKVFQLQLNILFEDAYLAVIEKPSGYPTNGNYFKTIEHALPYNLNPSEEIDALPMPMPVHRLDNPTSGVLLIAKAKLVQIHLNRQFENKSIVKIYTAIVEGNAKPNQQILTPINGKHAESYINTSKEFFVNNSQVSLIEMQPKTGRTHQLRLHCAGVGHPIIGDTMYGKTQKIKQLMLHASQLKFVHPITDNQMIISSNLPLRFLKLLKLS